MVRSIGFLWLFVLAAGVGCVRSEPPPAPSPVGDTSQDVDLRDLGNGQIINTQQVTFTDENRRQWKLQISTGSVAGGPVIFLPHDDENSAYRVALRYVATKGGKVIALDCNEQRNCDGKDPNRYFSESQIYSERIFAYFTGKYLVLTLHNNNPGYGGAKGVISACVNRPWPGARAYRYNPADNDCDNLVIINGRESTPAGVNRNLQEYLQAEKINMIYETYSAVNDGSASHGATARNFYYVNVEALETDEDRQYQILDKVYQWFADRNINSKSPSGPRETRE